MSEDEGSSPDVLFVSNGHGEDEVGARVGEALASRRPGLRIAALPLVGLGLPYERSGIELLDPRRELPSAGLLLHSVPLLMADLRGGFVGLTLGQIRQLTGLRCAALVVVGDVYAQLLSNLTRAKSRFVIQTLVSAYHAQGLAFSKPNRLFMERITWPERLLMERRFQAVYVRDAATEAALQKAGLRHTRFLGNPIADRLEGATPASLEQERRVVALLPGSRGYRTEALAKMLSALELLSSEGAIGAVAWVGGQLEPPSGWGLHPPAAEEQGLIGELRRGTTRALVYEGRFADVLTSARVVVGTSGTANEQAVALGRPVVAFPVPPHYSASFLANQKRLLGPALAVVAADSGEVALAVRHWLSDPAIAELAGGQGRARIGGPGGSEAIAADLLRRSEVGGVL
ncbi:MAG: lipid-A-disaccharide synthase-related protein [Trueperaceae bacterium]